MSSKFNSNKSGKPKAAGRGALDVFQSDNKDKHVKNGNIQQQSGTSTSTTSQPLPSPIIKSGKCSRCNMSDRVDEEVISCSFCCNLFHAVCRDTRGNYDPSAISTKSFYDTFILISNHVKPHQSRWGSFKFACNSCSAKNNKSQRAALKQKSANMKCNEAQTIISGNISNNFLDTSSEIIDVDNSLISSVLVSLDDVKQQNEKLLCAVDRSETLSREIEDKIFDMNNLVQSLKNVPQSSTIDLGSTQVDIDTLIQSLADKINLPCSPSQNQLQSDSKLSESIPKPFDLLNDEFLSSSEYKELSSFLEQSTDFNVLKSRNSEREILYFGKYDYRYGNIKHSASELPTIIRSIMEKIAGSSDSGLNSCLITKYNNGKDCCPSHFDNEPFIGFDSNIYTLSIGNTRTMSFKCDINSSTECVKLKNNSLLSFSRYSQEFWAHEIPADDSNACRFSLTFRNIAPMNANSSLIIGDSNTANLKFGIGKNTFGIWMPGNRIKASRIHDIPNPSEIKSAYRNIIFHTGINDIRATNPDPIPILANELQQKCISYTKQFPRCKIHISLILPTKDPSMNSLIYEFNHKIVQFSYSYKNINTIDHSNLCDPAGFLCPYFGRHTKDGNAKDFDTVHLGNKGIAVFSMNLKRNVVKMSPGNNAKNKPLNPINEYSSIYNMPMKNWSDGVMYNEDPFSQKGLNLCSSLLNRNSLPHFSPLPFPPPLPPPMPFSARIDTPGPVPLFPPLPISNSPSFVGDYRGAVCSNFQLNKQNDGYQT